MGFENNGQDCAIAAALYGLFGTTDNLDGIVKHAPSDAPEQRALKNKLTEMINLLRTKGCVPRNHMTELRSLLEISGELTSPDHIIDVIKQKLGVNDAIVNVDLSTTSGPLKISDGLNNIFNTLEAPTAQALIVNGQSTATRNAKQYEPQMEVTVKGQKYRLASVTVNTGGHYIVYSCSPKNTSFVMANSISTPVIRSALGLHSVINHEQSSERNYTKDQGAQKLLSLKGIATIEYDWDKVKQGSQYIYVKVEEDE